MIDTFLLDLEESLSSLLTASQSPYVTPENIADLIGSVMYTGQNQMPGFGQSGLKRLPYFIIFPDHEMLKAAKQRKDLETGRLVRPFAESNVIFTVYCFAQTAEIARSLCYAVINAIKLVPLPAEVNRDGGKYNLNLEEIRIDYQTVDEARPYTVASFNFTITDQVMQAEQTWVNILDVVFTCHIAGGEDDG